MYPATVHRQIGQRLRSGESVAAVATETGIAQATLVQWKRQALIDAGVIDGTPSVEADELAAAHKRIAELEAELTLTRDACELFNAEAVVPQNPAATTDKLTQHTHEPTTTRPSHGARPDNLDQRPRPRPHKIHTASQPVIRPTTTPRAGLTKNSG